MRSLERCPVTELVAGFGRRCEFRMLVRSGATSELWPTSAAAANSVGSRVRSDKEKQNKNRPPLAIFGGLWDPARNNHPCRSIVFETRCHAI